MNKPDWSKAPSVATHWMPVHAFGEGSFYKLVNGKFYRCTGQYLKPVNVVNPSRLTPRPVQTGLEPWRPYANTLDVSVATGSAIFANMLIRRMMRASK